MSREVELLVTSAAELYRKISRPYENLMRLWDQDYAVEACPQVLKKLLDQVRGIRRQVVGPPESSY